MSGTAGGFQATVPQFQGGGFQPQPVQQWGQPGSQVVGQQFAPPVQGQQLAGQSASIYPEQFADHLTEELRLGLDDCIDVTHVAAWAADQCLDVGPAQGEAARLANETSDLASVLAKSIATEGRATPAIMEAYLEVAELALDELEGIDAPHTNEAAMVIRNSIDSTAEALETI